MASMGSSPAVRRPRSALGGWAIVRLPKSGGQEDPASGRSLNPVLGWQDIRPSPERLSSNDCISFTLDLQGRRRSDIDADYASPQ